MPAEYVEPVQPPPTVIPEGVSPQEREAFERERAVVERENRVFRDALIRGIVTPEQYGEAMKFQRARLQDATAPKDIRLTAWTRRYEESQAFYSKAGYPQYGGVYDKPDLPAKTEVYSIKEVTTQVLGNEPKKHLEFQLVQEGFFEKAMNRGGPLDWLVPSWHYTTPKEQAVLRQAARQGTLEVTSIRREAAKPLMTAFTIGTAISSPLMAAASITGVAIGEAYKQTTTGQQMTWEETLGAASTAMFAAGVGQMAYSGLKGALQSEYVTGKVQQRIDASYRRQMELNEAIIQGRPLPKGAEAMTGPQVWTPTFGEKFLMRITKVKAPTVPAIQTVHWTPPSDVISAKTGLAYPQQTYPVEAVDIAFDLAMTPKSGLRVTTKPSISEAQYLQMVARSKVPISDAYAALMNYQLTRQGMKAEAAFKWEMELIAAEKGKIPESLLAYDYTPLSRYQKPELPYRVTPSGITKKYSYEWAGPYQKAPAMPKKTSTPFKYETPTSDVAKLTANIGGYKGTPTKTVQITPVKLSPTLTPAGLIPITAQKLVSQVAQITGFNPSVWQGPSFYGTKATKASGFDLIGFSVPALDFKQPAITKSDTKQAPILKPLAGVSPVPANVADLSQGATLKASEALASDLSQSAFQKAAQKQAQKQAQQLKQAQKLIQVTTPVIPKIPSFPNDQGGKKKKKKKGKSLLGGYGRFPREYPIVTGADFLEGFLNKSKLKGKGGKR